MRRLSKLVWKFLVRQSLAPMAVFAVIMFSVTEETVQAVWYGVFALCVSSMWGVNKICYYIETAAEPDYPTFDDHRAVEAPAELRKVAAELRQLHATLMNAGFSDRQASEMVGQIMKSSQSE